MTRVRSSGMCQVSCVGISVLLQVAILAATASMVRYPFYAQYWSGDVEDTQYHLSSFIGVYKMITQYAVGSCDNQVDEYDATTWAEVTGNTALLRVSRVTLGFALTFQILALLVKCVILFIKTRWGRLGVIYLGFLFTVVGFALSMVSMVYWGLIGLGGSYNILQIPTWPTNGGLGDDDFCSEQLYNKEIISFVPASLSSAYGGNWYDLPTCTSSNIGPAYIAGWSVVIFSIFSLLFEGFALNFLVFYADFDEEAQKPNGNHIYLHMGGPQMQQQMGPNGGNVQFGNGQQQVNAPAYVATSF